MCIEYVYELLYHFINHYFDNKFHRYFHLEHSPIHSIISIYCSTKDTHQLAEANREKNAKIREAFGLSQFYVDGSSLDPNRKHKELEAKAKALVETKYK